SLNRGPEADCQSCSGHAAIAARSAPADGIPLEQDDRSSLLSKLERSRQTGESTTDDGHVGLVRDLGAPMIVDRFCRVMPVAHVFHCLPQIPRVMVTSTSEATA